MNTLKITLFTLISSLAFSCGQTDTTPTEHAHDETMDHPEETTLTTPAFDVDSFTNFVNETRTTIENMVTEPVVVNSDGLRAKVVQKWEKIHFYLLDGKVVRIKTYPYENISARTEEFYLNDDALVLAIIEDNGEGERGKSAEEFDKAYYFFQGEVVQEMYGEKENEYGIKDSDGEELLAEVKEYLDIYAAQVK